MNLTSAWRDLIFRSSPLALCLSWLATLPANLSFTLGPPSYQRPSWPACLACAFGWLFYQPITWLGFHFCHHFLHVLFYVGFHSGQQEFPSSVVSP
jgi:hypothetical protein